MFYYGMRLRGFSVGCQPMENLRGRVDVTTDRYHDVIAYSRKLSENDLYKYDLDDVTKEGYIIQDRSDDNFIGEYDNLNEAIETVKVWEEIDRNNAEYVDYEIVML